MKDKRDPVGAGERPLSQQAKPRGGWVDNSIGLHLFKDFLEKTKNVGSVMRD